MQIKVLYTHALVPITFTVESSCIDAPRKKKRGRVPETHLHQARSPLRYLEKHCSKQVEGDSMQGVVQLVVCATSRQMMKFVIPSPGAVQHHEPQ